MPVKISTACQTFQASLRHVWASGSTYAEMTLFFGVTKDQLFRLRDRLQLPLRLDRSKRQKPPRYRDPTPEEIAERCAELRAKHLEARRNEPKDRSYRKSSDIVQYRLEAESGSYGMSLEEWLDNCGE
jgi:hypothetical protein